VDDGQCLAWGCKRALESFEFLFKVIGHHAASVLVFPAKVHGKLQTKIQERGASREELSVFVSALWCLSAHGSIRMSVS